MISHLFLVASFKIISLSLTLNSLAVMCLDVGFLLFILLEFTELLLLVYAHFDG